MGNLRGYRRSSLWVSVLENIPRSQTLQTVNAWSAERGGHIHGMPIGNARISKPALHDVSQQRFIPSMDNLSGCLPVPPPYSVL